MTTLDPSEGIALITDGSAYYKDRSGGWAWIALDAFEGLAKDSGYRSNTTNNQMELYAVTMGLDFLFEALGPCDVLVYSDSEYCTKGAVATTGWRKKNKKFWKGLDFAIERHLNVDFTHVKGHSGHIWNELADQMAGEARRKGAK